MAKDLCVKRALDDHKHSIPLFVIGLYVTGATLVCFLSMVYDILHGFRRRKPWLPCRFFSLNSLTLTFLSIATKLPVDLTTSMPSSQDQLSKLSGTALICISMGFFMPSLGIMSDKDGLANMASLTILVVAVVVNIGIQMSTGVIFSFIVEHIIILFCMLTLLVVLWSCMFSINTIETHYTGEQKNLLLKGALQGQSLESSMMQRLKLCYVHRYSSNPQLVLFQSSYCSYISILCTLCSVILSKVVLQSLVLKELKFCKGVSDYGWSMKIVVVTQILTVLVGTLATGFRWLIFVSHLDSWYFFESFIAFKVSSLEYITYFHLNFLAIKFSRMSFMKIFRIFEVLVMILMFLILQGLGLTSGLVVWLSLKLRFFFVMYKDKESNTINSMTEEFQHVVHTFESGLCRWLLRSAVEDVKRWMEVNNNLDSPKHLIKLLCKTPPSQESLAEHIKRKGQDAAREHFIRKTSPPKDSLAKHIKRRGYDVASDHFIDYRVSCLTIVYLVILATVSIPSFLSESLIPTLNEAFEIIYFIDKKLNARRIENRIKWRITKEVWMARDIIINWVKSSLEKKTNVVSIRISPPDEDLQHAVRIISELDHGLEVLGYKEISIIKDVIDVQQYATIKELYDHIEQIFVDLLQFFLTQLPLAIFKDVVESPAEESEKRARRAMKFLCKLEKLEAKVQWLFPHGANITDLLTTHAPTSNTHHSTQVERGNATVDPRINGDVGENIPTTHDEIIQEIV